MGLDFLDMNLRLEKRFGFRVDYARWEETIDTRGGFRRMTAGDVGRVVEDCLNARRLRRQAILDERNRNPLMLEYATPGDLPSDIDGDPWPEVRTIIAETLGVPVDRVKPEARLIGDLGMT